MDNTSELQDRGNILKGHKQNQLGGHRARHRHLADPSGPSPIAESGLVGRTENDHVMLTSLAPFAVISESHPQSPAQLLAPALVQ